MKEFVHDVHRQSDGFRLVRERAFDGLFDPPGGVSRKLCAFLWIEPFDALHQSNVPFIDKVEQRQAVAFVVPSDFNDQTQVRLDHLVARPSVAALDALGQFDLLLRRQQRSLANFPQVEMKRGVPVVGSLRGLNCNRRRFQLDPPPPRLRSRQTTRLYPARLDETLSPAPD